MKLLRLRLENFRQHALTDLRFSDGMTAIVGANGAGKTTLLEAITYALYGEQRDKKDTIRFHWAGGARFAVILDFELDGKNYEVERTNNWARLAEDDSLELATGLSEVTKACQKLLSLSYDQFINSFCAEQKGLAFLNFRSNTVRQDEVARMLGYDRLKVAEELALQRKKEFGFRRATLGGLLESPETLEAERKVAAERLKEVKAASSTALERQGTLAKELETALRRRNEAKRWLEITGQLDALRATSVALKNTVTMTQTALDECKTQFATLAPLKADAREYEGTEKEIASLAEKRTQIEQRQAKEKHAKDLEQKVQEQRELLAQVKIPDLEALAQADAKAAAELAKIESKIAKLSGDWNEQLRAAGDAFSRAQTLWDIEQDNLKLFADGMCPTCGQPIKRAKGQVSLFESSEQPTLGPDLETDLDSATKKVKQLQAKPLPLSEAEECFETISKKKAEDAKALVEARILDGQASTLRQVLKKEEEDLAALRKALTDTPVEFDPTVLVRLEARRNELKPKYHEFLKIRDCEDQLTQRQVQHEKAVHEVELAKTEYRAAEADRQKLPFSAREEAEAAVANHEKLNNESLTLQGEMKHANQAIEFAEREVERATAKLKELEGRRSEMIEVERQETMHELVARELKNLRLELNATLGPDLAARASESLSLLTNGRYVQLELDRNFAPSLVDDGVSKSVISGGEEDVVALALRLALSELIQERQGRPMSLLILDEVFGSLDTDRRQSVLDRLTALKGRFSQILVISHIEEINQVADQAIYLRRNPDTRAVMASDAPPEVVGSLF